MERRDAQLAAALLSLAGEPVPHDAGRETEAAGLRKQAGSDENALRAVLALCGEPHTPQEYYLCEKACSWLGGEEAGRLIRCAEAYLLSAGWDALPSGTVEERGIRIDLADRVRACVLSELAGALSRENRCSEAESRWMEAFRLEPYRAAYVSAAAAMLVRLGREREALDLLLNQRKSFYYRPVSYREASGEKKVNDDFRRAVDLAAAKLSREMKVK